MDLTKRKNKILKKLSTIGTTIYLTAIKCNMCLAADGNGSVGAADVRTATENIKRVIVSIAMPLGRCTYFCKCCCSST